MGLNKEEKVSEICRECYFGYKVEGEIYYRCSLDKSQPCIGKDRIDAVYENEE